VIQITSLTCPEQTLLSGRPIVFASSFSDSLALVLRFPNCIVDRKVKDVLQTCQLISTTEKRKPNGLPLKMFLSSQILRMLVVDALLKKHNLDLQISMCLLLVGELFCQD